MKLSPQLLRNVALGLGLGASLASCGMLETDNTPLGECSEDCTKEVCADDCKKSSADPDPHWDYCPACGMG